MADEVNDIALDDSTIHVQFHTQCEYGEVDDELIERLETIVNTLVVDNKQYIFSYINASNAKLHFKQFESIDTVTFKQIYILYRSFLIEDATEVENILIEDYKTDVNNRNIRNLPKRIINGGNDEYYVYIAIGN